MADQWVHDHVVAEAGPIQKHSEVSQISGIVMAAPEPPLLIYRVFIPVKRFHKFIHTNHCNTTAIQGDSGGEWSRTFVGLTYI